MSDRRTTDDFILETLGEILEALKRIEGHVDPAEQEKRRKFYSDIIEKANETILARRQAENAKLFKRTEGT